MQKQGQHIDPQLNSGCCSITQPRHEATDYYRAETWVTEHAQRPRRGEQPGSGSQVGHHYSPSVSPSQTDLAPQRDFVIAWEPNLVSRPSKPQQSNDTAQNNKESLWNSLPLQTSMSEQNEEPEVWLLYWFTVLSVHVILQKREHANTFSAHAAHGHLCWMVVHWHFSVSSDCRKGHSFHLGPVLPCSGGSWS